MAPAPEILTVGHSNHPIGRFLDLLAAAGATAVADVRSAPYSRRVPQFNREPLRDVLSGAGIAYVWLGAALGGKHGAVPPSPEAVSAALDRLGEGAARYRIALLCAEADPARCHRARLVAPLLLARGHAVRHLLADGRVEEHPDTASRMAALDGRDPRQSRLF